MLEQQADKQTPPANPDGPASATTAPVQPNTQGTPLTAEQLQTAYAEHPELFSGLKRRLKVNGQDVEVPLSELDKHAQMGLSANQRFEEAARLKADAELLKAQATELGDPAKAWERLMAERAKPAAPVNPLDTADDPFALQTAVRQRDKQVASELEDVKRQQAEFQRKQTEALEQMRKEQKEAVELAAHEALLAETRKANPLFTATVVKDATGKFTGYNFGSNPAVSRQALAAFLSGDTPDPDFNGRTGRSVPLSELATIYTTKTANIWTEMQKQQAAVREAEKANAAGGGPSASTLEIPSAIASMPDILPDGKPNWAKSDAIKKYYEGLPLE